MANQAGGNDNATVVVLDVMVGEPPSAGVASAGAVTAAGSAAAPTPEPGTAGPAASGDTMVVSAPPLTLAPPVQTAPAGMVTANGVGGAVVSRSVPGTDLGRPSSRRATSRLACEPRAASPSGWCCSSSCSGVSSMRPSPRSRWYVNNSYFVGLNHRQVVDLPRDAPVGSSGSSPRSSSAR